MGSGLGSGGIRNRISLAQAVVIEHSAAAGVALVVADRHTTLEVIDEPIVPGRQIGGVGVLGIWRQHRDGVDETIDGAALPPNDVVDGVPVHGGCRRHVGRLWSRCVVVGPGASCGAVLERDLGVHRALLVERSVQFGGAVVAGTEQKNGSC